MTNPFAIGLVLHVVTGLQQTGGVPEPVPDVDPQSPVCSEDRLIDLDSLALKEAPTLRFARGERYFPTLPFYTAFDGRSNNDDPRVDFDDPDEIAPLPEGEGSKPSWTILHERYSEELSKAVGSTGWVPTSSSYPPLSAALYRTRPLTEDHVRELWKFLRSDDQAWRRMRLGSLYETWQQGCQAMGVIEYYFYYVNDWGLEGHEEDIEFVFVFVPLQSPDLSIRVTVGAGHSERNQNNVFVNLPETGSPGSHILVELGGHASAPDANQDGTFKPGTDVNWHASKVWGTRDILALTGQGFVGSYRLEMTLDRTGGKSFRGPRGEGSSGYTLLPVSLFARLDTAIASATDPEQLRPALTEVADALPDFTVPDTLKDEVLNRVRLWRGDLCCGTGGDVKRKKHQVWEHENFKGRPTKILKAHLFRPTTNDITGVRDFVHLTSWSAMWMPDGTWGLRAGIVIPVLERIPIPFIDKKLVVRIPGFLTLEGGYAWSGPSDTVRAGGPTLSLTYDRDYSEYFTWYLATRSSWSRWQPLSGSFGHTWELSGGLSILAWSWGSQKWYVPVRVARFRVGPRIRIDQARDLLKGAALEFNLALR